MERDGQPVRKVRKQRSPASDGVDAAVPVPAGWGNDVTTIAADVDAGAEPSTNVVANDGAGMGEVEMLAATAGRDRSSIRERSVPVDDLGEGVEAAVVRVDVNDDDAIRPARHFDGNLGRGEQDGSVFGFG